jgi:hypothetical protein
VKTPSVHLCPWMWWLFDDGTATRGDTVRRGRSGTSRAKGVEDLARIFPASGNVGWAVVLAAWRSMPFGGHPEGETDNDGRRYDKPTHQAVAHFITFSPRPDLSNRRVVAI